MRCSVLGCKSDSETKVDGLSFHVFPAQPELRNLWIAATGRINWVPKKSSKICFQHFDRSHLIKKGKLTYLHTDAVPIEVKRKKLLVMHVGLARFLGSCIIKYIQGVPKLKVKPQTGDM